jgi:hypothetical protein
MPSRKVKIEIPPGFERTEELFIDPTNKKKYRVYYNAADGSRFYYEEPEVRVATFTTEHDRHQEMKK